LERLMELIRIEQDIISEVQASLEDQFSNVRSVKMSAFNPKQGIGTLVNHVAEGDNAHNAHVTPIYQTSTFGFPDVDTGAQRFSGDAPGYIYTRLSNPNLDQTAAKIAVLEGLDLLRAQPGRDPQEIVSAHLCASGMAAITTAIQSCVKNGETIIAQESLYSATYIYLKEFASRQDIQVIFLKDPAVENWEKAFHDHPEATLAYAETPANPTMALVDLEAVAGIAHRHQAWLMVDNTFATPYCQRPLTLGADVVVHSTTKYLSGHGVVIGGAVVSSHPEFMRHELAFNCKIMGGCASPFDAWLTHIGLKTFELRMQRHCENAMRIAQFLEKHPGVSRVFYPGLESHPDHALACHQMHSFGGMISFELKGGLQAGVRLMEQVRTCSLAVSLGNVDSLICHPASMTHSTVSREEREKMGLSDGLVRFSVGIENIEDLLADLDQALSYSH